MTPNLLHIACLTIFLYKCENLPDHLSTALKRERRRRERRTERPVGERISGKGRGGQAGQGMTQTEQLQRKPDYSRLTRAEINSVFALHKAGRNQAQIAETLGCNISTVSRWLDTLHDTTDQAKATARNAAQKLTERVIRDADVDQSLEVLDRLDVLPRKERGAGAGSQVNIVIGMPNTPAGNDPFASAIDLSPCSTQQLTE